MPYADCFPSCRNAGRMGAEVVMIELTQEHHAAVASGETLVRDGATNETYVLVRRAAFERLKELAGYDDSPWTAEEMDLLAEEAGDLLDRYQS
jgi:hypothetical protein